MNKVKILHSADLHFDTPFKELSSNLAMLSREELLEVFNNIIEVCKQESVDILLLAGDIFDNLTINKKTLFQIRKKLEEIIDVRVFISPGNHDPYHEKSFYKIIEWPSNVHIFNGSIESIYIEELNVVIWGGAFTKQHINTSLLNSVKAKNNSINIMVIHGDIATSKGGNDYNPITLSDIRESNMDYIALGHRHRYSGILREGNTCYAYSGCPQGRGFDELGDKGIILGEVYKGGVNLSFRKTSKRNYYSYKIDISDCKGYEEIKELVLRNVSENERENNLYKIILIGNVEVNLNFKEDIILEKLKKYFFYLKIIDNTNLKIDFEDISRDYSLKGMFVKKLLDTLDDADEEDKELIYMALKIGVQCLSEEEVNIYDY